MEKASTPKELAKVVKLKRKRLKLTQAKLALACGVGRRFIMDLEDGKETCQLGLTLKVLQMLGLEVILRSTEYDVINVKVTKVEEDER